MATANGVTEGKTSIAVERWSSVIGERIIRNVVLPIAFGGGVFLLWEIACRTFDISIFVLPAPSDFLRVLWDRFDAIYFNGQQTAITTIVGFAIGTMIGLFLGGAIGLSPTVYNAMYPTLIGFNCIPKVALVPVFVVWLGFGPKVAVLTSVLMAFFPVLVIVATSIAVMSQEWHDLLRSFGATKRQVLFKISIPQAMPQFFGAMKIAIAQAFIGTIIAEMIASNQGLGYLMVVASGNLDVPLVFAGLILLSAMGVFLYLIVVAFEQRLVFWAYRSAG